MDDPTRGPCVYWGHAVLVLVAFAVATMSLLVQGGTIGPLLRLIAPEVDRAAIDAETEAERGRLVQIMRDSAQAVPQPPAPDGVPQPEHMHAAQQHFLAVLDAQRAALLDARDNGTFDADLLESALANLDASQLAIEIRGTPAD